MKTERKFFYLKQNRKYSKLRTKKKVYTNPQRIINKRQKEKMNK